MRTTNIRFTGLASGLDTESMVQSMVMPYKMKVDTKWQQQTMMEWRKDAWKEMNSKLFKFYDQTLSKLRLESTFNKKQISVSNPNAITVDKNSTLPVGTHRIEEITQLAEGARVESEALTKDKSGKDVTKNTVMKDLGITTSEKISLNGKEISIDPSDTISEITKKMQQAAPDLNINFDEKAKAFFISSKKTGESQNISLDGNQAVWDSLGITPKSSATRIDVEGKINKDNKLTEDIMIKVNGINVKFDKDTKVDEMVNRLNSELNSLPSSGADKTKVEYKDGKIVITGEHKDKVEGDNVSRDYQGKNAIVSYNGVEVESETNNISVNGLNFTINSTTSEAITLVSSQDNDAIVEVVKDFVDEYNKLIEEIHLKLGASSARGYDPLTAEQKKEMSESDIEAWEKKIKDSLFRKDPDLKNVTDTMRQLLGGVVEGGAFRSLSEIGIATGDWKENGKLHFDEDKFRKALDQDTDGVIQLLAGSGDPKALYEKEMEAGDKSWDDLVKSELSSDKELVAKYQNRTKGFGDRLYDTFTEMTKSTTLRSTYSFYNDKMLDKEISQAKKDVKELEERMYRMEDMYYKKFTAMEKMMSQLNNQSSWLTSQLGGM